MRGVRYSQDRRALTTIGLTALGHHELRVEVSDEHLLDESRAFLETMVKYVIDHRRIASNETVEYGYWLIKFVEIDPTTLEAWERDAGGTGFVRGGTLALTYWKQQHEVCQAVGSPFSPPRPDKLAAVAAGVFEGDPVDAARFVPDGKMSGWCFFTDRYDGNIRSLKYEHLYHVTACRPDLAKYLALKPGFCFDLHEPERVWFDVGAAASGGSTRQ
jgi:hypothetical protein